MKHYEQNGIVVTELTKKDKILMGIGTYVVVSTGFEVCKAITKMIIEKKKETKKEEDK